MWRVQGGEGGWGCRRGEGAGVEGTGWRRMLRGHNHSRGSTLVHRAGLLWCTGQAYSGAQGRPTLVHRAGLASPACHLPAPLRAHLPAHLPGWLLQVDIKNAMLVEQHVMCAAAELAICPDLDVGQDHAFFGQPQLSQASVLKTLEPLNP